MGSGCSSDQYASDPNSLSLRNFEVHRVIGKGGFGKVNAIIRQRTNPQEWFALKTLDKHTIIKKQCISMVWNERNLLTCIPAKNGLVVAMHHAFQDEHSCYVVMDLLLGGDLRFHLQTTFQHGFSEGQARFYVAGVALSLQFLHSKSILHRDVKPENIILDNVGYPRLTDLGVSVHVGESMRYRGNSGTKSFMAPEMLDGNYEHGIAADFFALGIVAHQLLVGTKPWTTTSKAHIDIACPTLLNTGIFTEEHSNRYYPMRLLHAAKQSDSSLSSACRSFVRGLLHPNENLRLGYNGADEVLAHEWLRDFDWDSYRNQTLPAPFKPVIDQDNANCNTAAHDFDDILNIGHTPSQKLTPEEHKQFVGFEFNTSLV